MNIVISRSDGLRVRVTGKGVDGDLLGEVIDNAGAILTVRRLRWVEVEAYRRAQQSGKMEVAVIKYYSGVIKTVRYNSVHNRRYAVPKRKSFWGNKFDHNNKYSVRIGDRDYHFSKGLYEFGAYRS